jgi:hypothetical protein
MNRTVGLAAIGLAAIGLAAITFAFAGAGACARSSPPPPDFEAAATNNSAGRVPANYVLVGPAGTTAFDKPPARPHDTPEGTRLGPGFGFVATEERSVGGRRYVHLQDGRWLPAADVTRARPSTFTGSRIASGETLRLGWVITSEARVHALPAVSSSVVATRPAHTRVVFADRCESGWCRLSPVGWIRAADLAIPVLAARPDRAGPLERWLDVDLTSQTLVAYQGDQPLYATLISSGIGQRGSPLATPSGLFTIVSKHELVRMDNLQHTGVVPYAYDVPLAQYFTDGKALHAALWHDRFGHPTSHGCINMAPRDAEWLFTFTTPVLSPGGAAVSATTTRPGTLVRIRGDLSAVALR